MSVAPPDPTPLSAVADVAAFRVLLESLGLSSDVTVDDEVAPVGPLAAPVRLWDRQVGNRFCIHPMEGWDSEPDGSPSAASRHRWRAMGACGAKMLWNESIAVSPESRSTGEQLLFADHTVEAIAAMRAEQVEAHGDTYGDTSDLVVGVQLTHSGRYSKPDGMARPVAVRRHPYFDAIQGPSDDVPLLTDEEIRQVAEDHVRAAELAAAAGFDFVDLKACHGYLSHELLGAYDRPGEFGGSLENRARFLRLIMDGIAERVPEMRVALRLSAFDTMTHEPGPPGEPGRPITDEPMRYFFGTDESGHHVDLTEPIELLKMLVGRGLRLISVTGSSPYSVRHYQAPSYPRPGDRYRWPEDPLVGVARHLSVTAALKEALAGEAPDLVWVGGGYSYLQQFLANVAQARIRAGQVDVIGIARMHLAVPTYVDDVLSGRAVDPARLAGMF